MGNWLDVTGVWHNGKTAKIASDQYGSEYTLVSATNKVYREPQHARLDSVWRDTGDASDREVMQNIVDTLAMNQQVIPVLNSVLGGESTAWRDTTRQETADNNGTLALVVDEADQATFTVICDQESLLSRSTFQDGCWVAEMRQADDPSSSWSTVNVHKVSFLRQGVILQPGEWDVRFRYSPPWIVPCMILTLTGWIVFLLLGFRCLFHRIRPAA